MVPVVAPALSAGGGKTVIVPHHLVAAAEVKYYVDREANQRSVLMTI
jgi:hypothetical protein